MTFRELADNQTIVRHVRKGSLRRDEDANVIGVNPDAFRHRSGEDYLSATWAEHLNNGGVGVENAIRMFRTCLSVNRSDGYAIGSVGPIKKACARFSAKIRVVHEPDPPNDGHVAVRRVPRDNLELLQRLASVEWSRYVLDRDIS